MTLQLHSGRWCSMVCPIFCTFLNWQKEFITGTLLSLMPDEPVIGGTPGLPVVHFTLAGSTVFILVLFPRLGMNLYLYTNQSATDLLCICALHSTPFYWNPWSSTTPVSKISWQKVPLAFSTYLTPPFFTTCHIPTHRRKLCGKSTPSRCNYFHSWSTRCARRRASSKY